MLYNNTLFVPQILERSRRSAADVALVDFVIFSRQPNDKTVQAWGGEAEEHWGDSIQIPNLDPIFRIWPDAAPRRLRQVLRGAEQ